MKTIDRRSGKFVLLDIVGVLDEKTARAVRLAKRDFGKRLRKGIEAKTR